MRNFEKADWHNERVTESQIRMIQRIVRESDVPLEPFKGKTKGEAAVWIERNKTRAKGC